MSDYFSVSELSKHAGISEQYIRKMLQLGKIAGTQVGKTWVIPHQTLMQLKQQRRKEGVPDRNNAPPVKDASIKSLSFFSGAMGLDLGLEQSGITTLLASETDKACRSTISANKPEIGLIGDLRDYTKKDILAMAGLKSSEEVDVIAGGPPCQAFSTAGKRQGFHDERGNVFLSFIDLILDLMPRFVIIENVRGLLSAPLLHRPHSQRGKGPQPLAYAEQKGGALFHVLEKLRSGGYGVSFNLYNSANFGSPQIRERVVLLCSRDGKKIPYLEPTHSETGEYGLPYWRTLRQALDGIDTSEKQFVKFPEKRLIYYRLLREGQNWRSLPESLQKEALGNSFFAGGGKTGFLRRLSWDKPSPTLVTHPAMPATDLAHPEEDRPLSIQEYKRIQEFPDTWVVEGSLQDQYKQIGNAVPISLGRAIGKAIVSSIAGEVSHPFSKFRYSRYQNTDEVNWEKQLIVAVNRQSVPKQLSFLDG